MEHDHAIKTKRRELGRGRLSGKEKTLAKRALNRALRRFFRKSLVQHHDS